MKKLSFFPIFKIVLILFPVFFTGCASSRVHGNDPVTRSVSVTQNMVDGRTSDGYIEIYNEEMPQARVIIGDAVKRSKLDPQNYLQVADQIDAWVKLYDNIKILQTRYPTGLSGKKATAVFVYADYTDLRDTAKKYACDFYIEKGTAVANNTSLAATAKASALEYFEKARSYSDYRNEEIMTTAASVAYEIAEAYYQNADSLSGETGITTKMKALDYYKQAETWIPAYKDSPVKIDGINHDIANYWIAMGDSDFAQANYPFIRSSKAKYQKAEEYVPGIAADRFKKAGDALTVRIAYYYGGSSSYFSYAASIEQELKKEIAKHTTGPADVQIDFIYAGTGKIHDSSLNFRNYDLLLVPGDEYGKLTEEYGPVTTTTKENQITEENTTYKGVVIEKSQTVTVYYRNYYTLYDVRRGYMQPLQEFDWQQGKKTKKFATRVYYGDDKARPENLDAGSFYAPGSAASSFPEVKQADRPYDLLSSSHYSLSEYGKQFATILSQLNYIRHF